MCLKIQFTKLSFQCIYVTKVFITLALHKFFRKIYTYDLCYVLCGIYALMPCHFRLDMVLSRHCCKDSKFLKAVIVLTEESTATKRLF